MDSTLQIPHAELEARIEQYLLNRVDWVLCEEICRVFGVNERRLRDEDKQPGLCSRFAISRTGNGGGYRHVQTATMAEWREFKYRSRKHAIKELMRVGALDKKRYGVTRTIKTMEGDCVREVEFEHDTGQGLIPGLDIQRRTA